MINHLYTSGCGWSLSGDYLARWISRTICISFGWEKWQALAVARITDSVESYFMILAVSSVEIPFFLPQRPLIQLQHESNFILWTIEKKRKRTNKNRLMGLKKVLKLNMGFFSPKYDHYFPQMSLCHLSQIRGFVAANSSSQLVQNCAMPDKSNRGLIYSFRQILGPPLRHALTPTDWVSSENNPNLGLNLYFITGDPRQVLVRLNINTRASQWPEMVIWEGK